ncbi:unnamed protein product [Owenia fusiformis]|uniref:Uncharacterized protein n=1 Tax=Owenia fusiformis TaxID=6347 RepID=A0A8J1XLT7_OWEFU|nr:unnamed protein product [Owenia fusiformis]
MSDTDEDAFASADEGDVSTSIDKPKPTLQKPDESGDSSDKLNVQSQSDIKKNIDQSEGAISKTSDQSQGKKSDQSQGKKSSPKSDSAVSQTKGKKGRNKKSKNKKGKGNDAIEKETEKEENKHVAESETKSPRSDNLDTNICENVESVKEDIKDNEITESTTDSNPTDKIDDSEDKTDKINLKDDGQEAKENISSDLQELLSPQKEEIPRDTTPTRKIQRRSVKEDGGDIEHSEKEENILERLSGAATSFDTTHTDVEENVLDKLSGAANAKEKSGGWGWGWGGSILSTAATSVSTFTNQLEEGFSTVLETVESSLGVPDPDEIARIQKAKNESPVNEDSNGAVSSTSDADEENEEEEDVVAKQPEKAAPVEEDKAAAKPEKEKDNDDWFGSWGLSSINKVVEKTVNTVEKTGMTLVSGSIDVLETVGKKTYDVVTKPDPGLKKTRQMLDGGDKPNLSSMLRQAKDENEQRSKMEEEDAEARQAHFGTLFDEYKGLVHLEALEMLSNQCEVKVQSLLGALPQDKISSLKPDLIAIKEAFEIEDLDDDDEDMDEHDFEQILSEHFSELHIDGVSPSKLINVQKNIRDGLEGCAQSEEEDAVNKDCKEIHKVGIQALAELTARSVEQFKKIGELALLHKDNVTNFTVRAKTIANVTRALCTEVGILSVKFSQTLNTAANKSDNPDSVNPLITNIYLEATNSSTYIQDAFQLLLPILQQATLEKE